MPRNSTGCAEDGINGENWKLKDCGKQRCRILVLAMLNAFFQFMKCIISIFLMQFTVSNVIIEYEFHPLRSNSGICVQIIHFYLFDSKRFPVINLGRKAEGFQILKSPIQVGYSNNLYFKCNRFPAFVGTGALS